MYYLTVQSSVEIIWHVSITILSSGIATVVGDCMEYYSK